MYNCICACLDRIDELVEHCNALELKSLFGLYDIFNYGQTLIDCISMISKIYDVPYDVKNDISCFNQTGNDGSGNDEKYFKYLRSLCSVHPVETGQHKIYQGDEPEWCSYISGSGPLVHWVSYGNVDPILEEAEKAVEAGPRQCGADGAEAEAFVPGGHIEKLNNAINKIDLRRP